MNHEKNDICSYKDCAHASWKDGAYCILHEPSADKDVHLFEREIKVFMSSHPKKWNFEGFIFPREFQTDFFSGITLPYVNCTDSVFYGKISFFESTFTGHAYFHNTRFADTANFCRATFSQECNFTLASIFGADFGETTFMGEAAFINTTFLGNVLFGRAKFIGTAYFHNTLFKGDADFYKVAFESNAFFTNATFSEDTNFTYASFSGNVDYTGVKLQELADFTKSRFSSFVEFTLASFTGTAHFSGVTFSGITNFTAAKFISDALFDRAIFTDNVMFRVSSFTKKANFSECSFERRAVFEGNWRNEKSCQFFRDEADFKNVDIGNNAIIIFRGMDMSRVHLLNTDISDFRFEDVRWAEYSSRWFKRKHLCDDRPNLKKDDMYKVEILYRRLKHSCLSQSDHIAAGDFHIGEMEMKRRQLNRYQPDYWLSFLYKWLSLYGERWLRPLLWLGLGIIIFAIVESLTGVCVNGEIIGGICAGGETVNYNISMSHLIDWNLWVVWLGDLSNIAVYGLQVATLQRPSNITPEGSHIFYALWAITGASLIALSLLAMKRRFKR